MPPRTDRDPPDNRRRPPPSTLLGMPNARTGIARVCTPQGDDNVVWRYIPVARSVYRLRSAKC